MKTRLLLIALLSAVLAGCGGGGPTCASGASSCTSTSTSGGSTGGTTGGTSTTAASTVTVALSSNTVTSAAPVTVTATVKSSTGAAVSGAVVNFSVNAAIGTLSASAALTNSSGVASVTLSPAASTTAGADTVTASVTSGASTVTGTAGYQLSATTAAFASFTSNTGTAATDPLAAYGQAVLRVKLTGVSSAAPVTLSLTSACVTAGKATISPASVSNSSGTATFTYKDTGGCGSTLTSDTVTASITGAATSDTDQVFLSSPLANSITFTSASPQTIFLKGSGNTESSTVKFEVVDTAGNPLPGQPVTLSLSTFAGGLLIDQGTVPVTQTSDSNGFVSVIVNSGTVPTPVRVIAKLASGINTVSSNLAVVTGLPSQLNFSMSQKTINIEGAGYDGTPNTYTILAADRSGNPVPDGTSIIFWAEGGQIQGSATTATSGGISSATASFVSASPRPADGRLTVLAYAIGEESFVDLAGTNVWQAGDPFQDLGDVVKSKLYDGIYDSANDETVSLSLSGAAAGTSACSNFSANYPQFAIDPSIPSKPGTCDATWSGKTYVRRAVETVFSTSSPNALWPSKSGLPSTCSSISLYTGPQTLVSPSAFYPLSSNPIIYVGAGSSGSVGVIAADSNTIRLNPMPAGTTVTASAVDSTVATITLTGGSPIPSSSTATGVSFSYKLLSGATQADVILTFTTPKGLVTPVQIRLVAAAAPSTCP